jgi:hypothetical protein
MTIRVLSVLALLLWFAPAASGQSISGPTPPPAAQAPTPAEPQYPAVRVGVLSYLQYDAELENRDGFNAFDVTRTYLNVNGQLARNVRFRVTPDIRRFADSTGQLGSSLVFRIKYAFVQFDNVGAARSWIRFGINQTPVIDFEESIDRYRVQGTMFAEREPVVPGSGDAGVAYFTPLPKNYGEVHVGIYNGEGYGNTEINKYKSVQGRLTVRPFPSRGLADGLRVTGFVTAGWYAAGRPRHVGIAMASYEHRHLAATIQRVLATDEPLPTAPQADRNGWSIFLEPRQGPTGWAGIARIDAFDPDDSIADNSHRRTIIGGAYWFPYTGARLGLIISNEQVHYDRGAVRPTENRLLVQTHVEF